LREDEAVGQHFLNLDSGLPTEELKTLVRDVIADGSPGGERTLSAVNRRGRSVRLRVRVSPLRADGDAIGGALLLMDAE
jgi:two-component system CheB/CheR fusion protein